MADAPIVHIGENSPAQVAYKLMHDVNAAEDHPKRTRDQILDLYVQCIRAVKGNRIPLRADHR